MRDPQLLVTLAQKWAKDLKLKSLMKWITPDNMSRLYNAWQAWQDGEVPAGFTVSELRPAVHGVTFVRGGRPIGITISKSDPPDRQALAVVHEGLHAITAPHKPPHQSLHTLAAGLAKIVFPRVAELRSKRMNELALLNALGDDDEFFDEDDLFADDDIVAELLGDDEDSLFDGEDFAEMAGMGIPVSDDEYDAYGLFGKKFGKRFRSAFTKALPVLLPGVGSVIKKKIVQKQRKRRRQRIQRSVEANKAAAAAMAVPTVQEAGEGGQAVLAEYDGWVIPFLKRMYETNCYLLPRRGLVRAAPTHNFSGWKAGSFQAWWTQLINSLNSGAGIVAKEYQRATAAPALPTQITFSTARAAALLIRLSDSLTNADNANIQITFFDQVGPPAGIQQNYILDIALDKGVAEFLIMYAENDRGGGVPVCRNDHRITVAADGMRAGMVLSGESITYRDMQNNK